VRSFAQHILRSLRSLRVRRARHLFDFAISIASFDARLLLLKHIYELSDEGVCERWVHGPYFQYFTGEEFFQHAFAHERSDLSHWSKRLGENWSCCWPRACGWRTAPEL